MRLVVCPTPSLKGILRLPSSKSYSIRSVLIAACGGQSIISNLSHCKDVQQALKAARALRAKLSFSSDRKTLTICANRQLSQDTIKVHVGESGTVLRFLLPLLALRESSSLVLGEGTLRFRPNRFLTQTLRAMGKEVRGKGFQETIPIRLTKGALRGGDVTIDGSLSSQFISALLMACPLLEEDTRLRISGKTIVSRPYVCMTLEILKRAGIAISRRSDALYFIKGRQVFKGLKCFTVPSDYGLAAFLLAAGALISARLIFKGSFDDTLVQADGQILKFLKQMGVKIEKTKQSLKIYGPYSLRGGSFSLKDCPDLVPIMAVLGLFAKGPVRLCNIAHARVKESDRISDLHRELVKVGAKIQEKKDELIIFPQAVYRENVVLDPHHDHRLAMAFTVLGLKIGVTVKDMQCVAKSYPEFIEDVRTIGFKLQKG